MRKPGFCICENKDADQLRSYCAAGQHLCFRYMDSAIPLLSKSKFQASSHPLWLYSTFVSATWIVLSLFYLNPKFQASSHPLWLYRPVCVGPGQKPPRPVFSQRGSYMRESKEHGCVCLMNISISGLLGKPTKEKRKEKNLICRFCGKAFQFRYMVTRHERIHTGEKPYTCEICGKSFAVKRTLSYHRVVHTGEKAYSCEFCGETFSQYSNRNRHRLVHVPTDSK